MSEASSSSNSGSTAATEYVFSDAEGLVITASPSSSSGSYTGVTEYAFSDAEGTVIIADPPAAASAYEGITETVEFVFSDEEGLTVVARPSRVQLSSSRQREQITFEDEEGIVIEGETIEVPPVPYEGILDIPRVGPPPTEVTQGLTTTHRELLTTPRISADKIELFETPEAIRTQIERWMSPGGTSEFLADYKDRWVRANREIIKTAAETYGIPSWVLAAVAWTEVGGDPPWLDEIAIYARLDPTRTSFGPVQMQIYRAAEELGYDPTSLSPAQRRLIIWTLLDPQQNLFLVASHLRRLKDIDAPGKPAGRLSDDDVRLMGARFNRGAELSRRALLNLGQRTRYGDDLVRRKERSMNLLKD